MLPERRSRTDVNCMSRVSSIEAHQSCDDAAATPPTDAENAMEILQMSSVVAATPVQEIQQKTLGVELCYGFNSREPATMPPRGFGHTHFERVRNVTSHWVYSMDVSPNDLIVQYNSETIFAAYAMSMHNLTPQGNAPQFPLMKSQHKTPSSDDPHCSLVCNTISVFPGDSSC